MEENEETCSECRGQVEYDESAHSYVCIECGSASTTSVRLVSQELAKDVGGHRRVKEQVKRDDRAFERRAQLFASVAICISRNLGDTSATLNLDMVNFARVILAAIPPKPAPQHRKVEMFGIAAAYLRAKRRGLPITLNDVACVAQVEPKSLYAGYKIISRHTNVPQPSNPTQTYFMRFLPVAEKLISNSAKFLSHTYNTVLRVLELFYSKSGRSRLFVTAVTMMFAIRSIACEQLEPIIPTVGHCAHEISRCGIANVHTISKRSLEVEYRYLEQEIGKKLMAGILQQEEIDVEVHANFGRLHDSLFEKRVDGESSSSATGGKWKIRESMSGIVASIGDEEQRRGRNNNNKRKNGNGIERGRPKRQRTGGEDDNINSDDSEIEEAILTEEEVVKRARELEIDYTSPVTD